MRPGNPSSPALEHGVGSRAARAHTLPISREPPHYPFQQRTAPAMVPPVLDDAGSARGLPPDLAASSRGRWQGAGADPVGLRRTGSNRASSAAPSPSTVTAGATDPQSARAARVPRPTCRTWLCRTRGQQRAIAVAASAQLQQATGVGTRMARRAGCRGALRSCCAHCACHVTLARDPPLAP